MRILLGDIIACTPVLDFRVIVIIYVWRVDMLFFFSSRRRHTRLQGDWSSDVCFFESIRRHTRLQGDWSSDVCSSDLKNPSGKLWPSGTRFSLKLEPLRWSPVIHVNQTGYLPGSPQKAMVGFYLGSLGEMDVAQACGPATNQAALTFTILQTQSHKQVFQ